MDTQVYYAANSALRESFTAAEEKKAISKEVRWFIRDLVLESLRERSDIWREERMDPDNAESVTRIEKAISTAVTNLLESAPATGKTSDGKKCVLLKDILDRIKEWWGDIFPFR